MNCQHQSRQMAGLFNLMFCVWCWASSEGRAQSPLNLPTQKFFSSSADLVILCFTMKKLIIHPNPQISPQSIRGHPWSSEGTPEPDRNSPMEEIFVRKSRIAGTRVFLGTRQVWGPASRTQAKVPLKTCPPASTLSLTSPAGLPGATDPGLLHHLGHSGAGSLLTLSSKDVCFRFNSPKAYRILLQGWELPKPGGGEEAGYPGKGESWNLSCQAR